MANLLLRAQRFAAHFTSPPPPPAGNDGVLDFSIVTGDNTGLLDLFEDI